MRIPPPEVRSRPRRYMAWGNKAPWLSEWKAKLASGLLAEVEPDGEHKSSFWFLKLEELLEMT